MLIITKLRKQRVQYLIKQCTDFKSEYIIVISVLADFLEMLGFDHKLILTSKTEHLTSYTNQFLQRFGILFECILEYDTNLIDLLYFSSQQRALLEKKAGYRTSILTWVGLSMMAVQFGILARLTWWEYSWDIMEPVTYFVTYGTAMATYAYFALTKQVYLQHTRTFTFGKFFIVFSSLLTELIELFPCRITFYQTYETGST